jgi:hypothetical protein
MPWRDFLCKKISGQINKLRVFVETFSSLTSRMIQTVTMLCDKEKNMSMFRQQELPGYLNQMPNITQGHHHTQKNCVFLLQSCTPSKHQ